MHSMKSLQIFSFFSLLFVSFSLQAKLCSKWQEAQKQGIFEVDQINESSGIEISQIVDDRLYHINDSGDGPYFYLTNLKGESQQKIAVEGFSHFDMEDLSVEKCLKKKTSCLYLADIGDNRRVRDYVEIIEIEEQKNFLSSISFDRKYKIRYPDRKRNAEAFAVHPNGDFYLLSKEEDGVNRKAWPARLYRLSKKEREKEKDFYEWELLGAIDLPWLMYQSNLWGQMATSMDISHDGQKLLVLTYEHAIEFSWDLARDFLPTREMIFGRDYQMIKLKSLPQQEAITYGRDEKSFLYSTEFVADEREAAIMSLECL